MTLVHRFEIEQHIWFREVSQSRKRLAIITDRVGGGDGPDADFEFGYMVIEMPPTRGNEETGIRWVPEAEAESLK